MHNPKLIYMPLLSKDFYAFEIKSDTRTGYFSIRFTIKG